MARDIIQALLCANLIWIIADVETRGTVPFFVYRVAPSAFAVIGAADLIAKYAEWFR